LSRRSQVYLCRLMRPTRSPSVQRTARIRVDEDKLTVPGFPGSSGSSLNSRSPAEASARIRTAVPDLKARESPPGAVPRRLQSPRLGSAEKGIPTMPAVRQVKRMSYAGVRSRVNQLTTTVSGVPESGREAFVFQHSQGRSVFSAGEGIKRGAGIGPEKWC
jgi:hypothetical protein